MESYFKSWEGIAKEYKNFSQIKNDFEMKNSLEFKEERERIGSNESRSDSLPIHCIIQNFSSLRDLRADRCLNCEEKNGPEESWWECECKKNEMSGCIVVPEDTSMSDLVKTALVKLGYPASASSFATGSILIRNWKPLPLEVICPDMKKSVADILGEITAVVSLRIQIFRPKITTTQRMKDSLLLFLFKANQSFLRDSHCPFDTSFLSKFCDESVQSRMHFLQEPPQDFQKKFESWLEDFAETEKTAAAIRKTQFQNAFFYSTNNNNNNNSSNNNNNNNNNNKISANEQQVAEEKRISSPQTVESSALESNGKQLKMPSEKENLNVAKEVVFGVQERPKFFPTPKTRVRTSFDPEFELPKLQKWFLKNPHPSRQQIYEYVAELNSLESRKGRKQLDVNNVVYWFKNARAAQKRTECRRFNNATATETNRCNVLRIPLGKNCGVSYDDQRSVSDDDASVTSEFGDDYRQDNGRCLQVVGKWNSNGQGEAVLEMQIPSRKSEFTQSVLSGKKDKSKEDDNEKNVRTDDKSDSENGTEKNSPQKVHSADENPNENRNPDVSGSKENQKQEDGSKSETSLSKAQVRSSFPPYKESNNIESNDFLSSYKPGFPVTPNSVLNSSFMCMSQYMSPKPTSLPLSSEERRKRNRTFIDPVTEVPRLEQWFRLSTHPSHSLIARYTEELNNMPYRRKFPKLEAKNVQFWFKNRRAKNKRLNYIETGNN